MELNREVYVMEANAVQEKVPRIANLQDFIQASLVGIQVFGKTYGGVGIVCTIGDYCLGFIGILH